MNYRSCQGILDVAAYIRNLGGAKQDHRPPLTAHLGTWDVKPQRVHVRVPPAERSEADLPETVRAVPNGRFLAALTDAALDQLQALDGMDAGRVAFIAADTRWIPLIEQVLMARGRSFSTMLGRSIYQVAHVANVLVHLQLIATPDNDDTFERLLRRCVVPYLDAKQIKALQAMRTSDNKANARSFRDLLADVDVLARAQITDEQLQALQAHLAILTNPSHTVETKVRDIWAAIEALPENPIASVADDPNKLEDLQQVQRQLGGLTVSRALQEVTRHITFLDEHVGNTALILTTVDHAKNEEFDTVFVLGAHLFEQRRVQDKRRLYVAVSRAKRWLYLLCNEDTESVAIVSAIPSREPSLSTVDAWQSCHL